MFLTNYSSSPDSKNFLENRENIEHGTSSLKKPFDQMMEEYFASCKAKIKSRKKRKRSGQYTNTDPFIKFLRQRISRLNHGVKLDDCRVRPEMNEEKLKFCYNSWHYGAALRNDQFRDHFASRATYYFWADHLTSTPEILVMIDGDCGKAHGGGTTEGVRKFMELVKTKLFPGLYLEPSTNGEGIHGYFILEKPGIKTDLVRQVLKNLDRYLKKLAQSVNADIACVEIKGLPPSIQYDDKGKISSMTFGLFAKLPRGRGVLDTCKVDYEYLALLDPDEIEVPQPQPEKPIEKKLKSKLFVGSYDSRVVRQETLDKLPDLEKFASSLLKQWTGTTSLKAGRWTVTATDLAQFFALMLCIKPKPDDSLPVRAVGRLWEKVYLAGDFSRPWNHHRFKAMRDLLSRHGHIDWLDFRFQYLPERKGRCCRWQISYELQSFLSLLMGEATVVDTKGNFPDGPHEFRKPLWFNFVWEQHRQWLFEAEKEVASMFAA